MEPYAKPHFVGSGSYHGDTQWEICGCGFAAESISSHIKEAEQLTKEYLEKLDASKHISYWCGIHDHCCCTDSDWAQCNCFCHTRDGEERRCRVRLARWGLARVMATNKLREGK